MAVNYYWHPDTNTRGAGGKIEDFTGRRGGVDHFDTRGQPSFANYNWAKGDTSYKGQGGFRASGKNWQSPWQVARSSPYWNKYQEYVLPGDRDWLTTWKASRKQDSWVDEASGTDPRAMGWKPGIHMTTGRERSRYETSGGYGYDTAYNLIEVLDYGAYNQDPRYREGLKGLGRDREIGSLQDILDIEEFWSTGITDKMKAEKQAWELEKERVTRQNELLQQQLDQARGPRLIDVGGTEVAEGGVSDYISQLQNAWQQRSASDLDLLSRQLSGQFDQRYAQQQGQFDQRYAQQQQMYDRSLSDAQAQWQSLSEARDKVYDTRIADLTAGWDTQRSMYDTSLSNLSGQLGRQQQAYGDLSSEFAQQRRDWDTQRSVYDTSLANLNKSISDYQSREQARQEQMAIEAQRARTAAAYGREGEPMNPSVSGVKTTRGLTDPRRNRYGSSFKRSDMTIVNKQLNI